MAKKESKSESSGSSNVIELSKMLCLAEGCKKKSTRAEFCDEHFTWYKEGLINGKGEKPTDFDKKFIAFKHRNKPAA